MPTSASFHQSLVDWVDVEYYRNNSAQNDSILIVIPDSVTTAFRNVQITNIVSPLENLLLYKISPTFEKIENFVLSGGASKTLVFSDTVAANDSYLLISKPYIKSPIFVYKKQFVNLRNSSKGADYIIVSNKSLQSSVKEYESFINENYDVRTSLVFVDDIFDEFAFGAPNAEAIRDFLYSASKNWPGAKPSYVLLMGEANYDYKNIFTPAPAIRKKNLVPSFGNPVSDTWFTMWDTLNEAFPQMYVGRISASSDEQVRVYLTKHKNYITKSYDSWNKQYLFFSGGDPTKPTELAQIKSVNDELFNNHLALKPIGGVGKHFFKTIDPPTNFGPYSQEEITKSIAEGAILISYVGHSGTQTWDNGITKVEDLKNIYTDRFPLISDFGCSTGKFAEPDVDAFGETFICQNVNGQAINYLGNSSWGYLSTSLRFPLLFNHYFIGDTVESVGAAHYLAKMEQMIKYGINDVNVVFTYCNTLFGDPIITLKIPPKPNFVILNSSIRMNTESPNDVMDSLGVTFTINNYGRVPNDSLKIFVADYGKELEVYSKVFTIPAPYYEETIKMNIPIKNSAGDHVIKITLDKDNIIDELSKSDNYTEYHYKVYSSSFSMLEKDKYYNTGKSYIRLINPSKKNYGDVDSLSLLLSLDESFKNALPFQNSLDSVYTQIPVSNLSDSKRYYWKAKLNSSGSEWSATYSFKNIFNGYDWFVDSSYSSPSITTENILYDSVNSSWRIAQIQNSLEITSAGSNEGKFGSMFFNKSEFLPNTFYWGIATALIDSITYMPTSIKYFVYPSATSAPALKNYIDSLADGTLLAMTICDDGAQSVLGYTSGTAVRKSIAQLGSNYIDSVRYRESWCILGKKGAQKGTVPESYKKLFEGQATIAISKKAIADSGKIIFPQINNSVNWKNLFVENRIPIGAMCKVIPLGIKSVSEIDTLNEFVISDNKLSLSSIDARTYPSIKLMAKLYANADKQSPEIKSVGVEFSSPPELTTNYQVVSVSRDTLIQGDSLDLKFYVYNVGESPADSFHVSVDVMKNDNSSRQLLDTVVASLDSMQRQGFNLTYKTNGFDGKGNMGFKIKIDPDNRVREFYEDNNEFTIPFYTKPDTNITSVSASTVAVTFDHIEILNGDFVSNNPKINIELNYPTWFAVRDTSALSIMLDNQKIPFDQLKIKNDSANRMLTFDFNPLLNNGEHQFSIFGNNVYGKLDKQPGFERVFTVSNELAILNCYTYPNPAKENTYFTFKLPKLPEELTIRVYTIAGRLIKEIKKSAAELHLDFNRIFWDTKDEDGNALANGVYLYKVIAKHNGKSESITQKLAIVK